MSQPPIKCIHVNHFNVVVDGFRASLARLEEVLGARFNVDLARTEWDAGLFNVGGVLFELFAPKEFLLNARYGPHYVGLEFEVPDVEAARAAIQARGIRIIRDLGAGIAFHTHPADAYGVSLELYQGNFHERENPYWLEQFRPAGYWRDEHPLGCTGLKRYSILVNDLPAVSGFFQEFLGAEPAYETRYSSIAADVVGLSHAGTVVEIMTPFAPGAASEHLRRYGDGIRSVVFAVADLEQARRYFGGLGRTVHPGDADDAIALAPSDTCGVMFEFAPA